MLHQVLNGLREVGAAVVAHFDVWETWAVLVAAAIYGWRRAPVWTVLAVGLVVNPAPYGLVGAVIHGRPANWRAAALLTMVQLGAAVVGFGAGRLAGRLR